MTNKLRTFILYIIRLLVVWLVDAFSLLIVSAVYSGIVIEAQGFSERLIVAAAAALVLGVINFIIRPIILLLAAPFGFVGIFLVGFFMSAIVLMISSNLLPQFEVTSWWSAFIGGFIIALVNTILTNLLTIDDDDSYYQKMIERRALKHAVFTDSKGPGQGTLMLEIDGLSYHHFQKALADGYMPAVSRLIDEEGYKLHRVETGIPSMTSACQAGILYGDNYDIPSFRWYDRDLKRFVVSQMDATMLDQRYSKGQGLARGGSSIGNMLNGDALKSMFVIATLRTASEEEKKERARDIYLMMLNPYFFVRTIVLFFGDAIMEILQYVRQVVKKVEPRLNRLHNGYPLMRAALTSFLKDVSAYLIILDIIRGTPALYHTYAGYDEMAHHAGPWTTDAFHELKRLDKVIARLLRVIQNKATRPYELILLSDHGQSFGHTFLQRYGVTLQQYIQQNLPEGKTLEATASGDDGSTSMASMVSELDNVNDQGVSNVLSKSMIHQTTRLMKIGVDKRQVVPPDKPADVKVAFSGNFANVYFLEFDHRVKINELASVYPGIVKALVEHEGVGFVVGYNDVGEPVCIGKDGVLNLHTSELVGENPLAPFADGKTASVELRQQQLRRVADYPHAGDLIVNSPVYPDGTVAAYEELIGNHGGMGGEQTDAFILGPADMQVPETQNSSDVYAILDARRGLVPQPKPVEVGVMLNPWSPSVFLQGLGKVSTWLNRAARCLVFDRESYAHVAQDAYMTAPALLFAILAALIPVWALKASWQEGLARFALWLIVSVLTWLAGRRLGSKQDFTPLLRTFGFAQVSYIWLLLALIPQVAPLARLITSLVLLLSTWIGAVIALKLKGRSTFILPIVAVVLFFVGVWGFKVVFAGLQLTLQTLLATFGIQ